MVDWGVLVRRRYYRFSVSPWVSIFRVAHFSSITVQLNRNLCLSYALSFALPHGFSLLDSCIQRKIQNGSMYSAHNINTIHRLYKIKAPPIRAQIHPSVRRHHRYCSDFSTKHFFGIHFLPFSKYTNTFIRLQSLCIYNTVTFHRHTLTIYFALIHFSVNPNSHVFPPPSFLFFCISPFWGP